MSMLIQSTEQRRKEHHRCSYFIHPNDSASKKIRKASRSFPQLSYSGGGSRKQRTGKQVTSPFWAVPPPQWLHWGIHISCPSISSHVQLAQIKKTWIYIVQLSPLYQPCLFFEGQSLARAGVLDVQINISKIYFSSDTWGSCTLKCNLAFYLFRQGRTSGPVKLTWVCLWTNRSPSCDWFYM